MAGCLGAAFELLRACSLYPGVAADHCTRSGVASLQAWSIPPSSARQVWSARLFLVPDSSASSTAPPSVEEDVAWQTTGSSAAYSPDSAGSGPGSLQGPENEGSGGFGGPSMVRASHVVGAVVAVRIGVDALAKRVLQRGVSAGTSLLGVWLRVRTRSTVPPEPCSLLWCCLLLSTCIISVCVLVFPDPARGRGCAFARRAATRGGGARDRRRGPSAPRCHRHQQS